MKFHRQLARFGSLADGMPALWVYKSADGLLVVYNGVTRATRFAKQAPGTLVPVDAVGRLRKNYVQEPSIGDLL
jgi:hypothetical protein